MLAAITMKTTAIALGLTMLALSAIATSALANGTTPTEPTPTCPPGVQSCNIAGGQQTNTQTATQTQGDLTQSIGDQRGHTIGRQTATTTSGPASTNSGNITTRGGAGGKAVATGGHGGNSRSTSSVNRSGNSTNTVGNVNNIDASQRTTIKHAANTAAMIDMQGYGTGNCLGDTNPSGQFGASIQTFGWGVTANSMKASNVCAMLKIAGPRAALAYLAQMDRNAHRALVNNGLAVTRAEIEAQVRAEAEAERRKQRRASTQKLACPSGYDLTARQDGSMTCLLVGAPKR